MKKYVVPAGLVCALFSLDASSIERSADTEWANCADSSVSPGQRNTVGSDINQASRASYAVAKLSRSAPGTHIPFIVNEGQQDGNVKFYAPMFAGTVFVTRDGGIVYSLPSAVDDTRAPGLALQERLVGAAPCEVRGVKQAKAKVNHFVGNDKSKWRNSIPTYDLVDLGEIYDGIHLQLKAYANNVEKLFMVDPDGRPEQIRMQVIGVDTLRVNDSGELEAETELGVVTFTEPIAYQEHLGQRTPVQVAYSAMENEYGFAVGEYDATQRLIIDPLLASTLIGGNGIDGNYEVPVVVGDSGEVYIASRAQSLNFPATVGAYDPSYNGHPSDIFVAKFDADLTTLLASTFLGGSGGEGLWPGVALALAGDGSIYVAGNTDSPDFPTTPGAYDPTPNGVDDAFVCQLSGDLGTLLASTLLGGAASEAYVQIELSSDGAVYLAGATASAGFPTTPGAYSQTLTSGGDNGFDLFISKFSADLTTLLASTFLGGSHDDFNEAVRIGGDGSVYVTGWTRSTGYPTTPASYSPSYNGGTYDAFVSRLDGGLTTLTASTFLGGSAWDFGYGLALDESGFVYVSGHTASQSPTTGFPTTPGAYSESYNGDGGEGVGDDAFVSKFDGDLATLVASTFLGGTDWENATFMEADGDGHIYVAGATSSADYPTTVGAFDRTYAGDNVWAGEVFVSSFDTDLTSLSASTYLGGESCETVGSIRIDGSGNVYVAGATNSWAFPTTAGAYDRSYNGPMAWDWGGDVFVARLDKFLSADCNANGIPDACDLSCGTTGGDCDIAGCGLSDDCNGNSIPDECSGAETDANGNGIPDDCEMNTPVSASPPHDTRKNRYVSFDPNNLGITVALAIEMTESGESPSSTGPLGWVGQPDENDISRVVVDPYFTDGWPEVVHVGDCEIVPVATYSVRATPDAIVFSVSLEISTILKPINWHYGDVVGMGTGDLPPLLGFTSPNGVVNVSDVQAFLLTMQGPLTPCVPTTWVDLHGLGVGIPPNFILNVSDLQRILWGIAGQQYLDAPEHVSPGDCP
ncbi:MAG: DUF7948 domain-containing protein [Planctomycetota bacterium]